jgi:hypothetical protein
MKIAIASLLSLIVGFGLGLLLSPANQDSEVAALLNRKLLGAEYESLHGKWNCKSSSGWTGVFEILPGGELKAYQRSGKTSRGTWSVQTGLRFHHENGGEDNFDLPNPEGAIYGVSNQGNRLSMMKTQ